MERSKGSWRVIGKVCECAGMGGGGEKTGRYGTNSSSSISQSSEVYDGRSVAHQKGLDYTYLSKCRSATCMGRICNRAPKSILVEDRGIGGWGIEEVGREDE